MTEEKYRGVDEPLVFGCDCYSCKNHHKAYIFHLLECHEMTGTVLINIHNVHHYDKFFKFLRNAKK